MCVKKRDLVPPVRGPFSEPASGGTIRHATVRDDLFRRKSAPKTVPKRGASFSTFLGPKRRFLESPRWLDSGPVSSKRRHTPLPRDTSRTRKVGSPKLQHVAGLRGTCCASATELGPKLRALTCLIPLGGDLSRCPPTWPASGCLGQPSSGQGSCQSILSRLGQAARPCCPPWKWHGVPIPILGCISPGGRPPQGACLQEGRHPTAA